MTRRDVLITLVMPLTILLLGVGAMGVACWGVTSVLPHLTAWYFPTGVVTARQVFIYGPPYVYSVMIAYGIALCVPAYLMHCLLRMITRHKTRRPTHGSFD